MKLSGSQYLLDSSREYAIYVCENRAIPLVHDGLKHGQRVALWVMRDKADKIKTIALSGLLSYQKLYVHGDASCNEAISQLAAPFKNNHALLEPHGAFGSRIAPDDWGEPRYTSVSRSQAAQAFLYNDAGLVPLVDNYDGSAQQPMHFLPLIPTVLLNGVTGIAVGWSTNILPHALSELIAASKQALLNKPLPALQPAYRRYDLTIEPLGPNQWQLSGKATVKDTSTIQITELPPGLSIKAFRKRLIAMEDSGAITGYVDRSTDAIDLSVKFPRGSIAGWSSEQAIEFFKLREKVTERIVVVGWDGKTIKVYDSPQALVSEFVQWRLGWFATRFETLRDDSDYELVYWLAIRTLFAAKFPKRLGTFADRAGLEADVRSVLGKRNITVDDAQLERIASLPTYRWTQAFAAEVEQKIASLQAAVQEYRAILGSPERLRQVYLDELDAIRIPG